MFTRIAENLGLFDIMAPRKKTEVKGAANRGGRGKNTTNDAKAAKPQQQEPVETDEERVLRMKQSALQSQEEKERQAEMMGLFVKKQRVRYLHKATEQWFEAHIIGVHLDDGPDKPYYTIKYKKYDVAVGDDGNEVISETIMEKQTTPDRLERVPFCEDESWKLIQP
jgi:hypothetical protein